MIFKQSKTKKLSRDLQKTGDFFKERRNIVGVSLAVVGAAGAVGLYQVGKDKINEKARHYGRLIRKKF